jgi:hypothetical protein
MKLFSLALLAAVLSASASLAEEVEDEEDFDAAAIIKAWWAEGVGCSGIDVDGSKLDEEVRDRRCAVFNGLGYMPEDHGHCFDEAKQVWALCAKEK